MLGGVAVEILEPLLVPQGKWVEEKLETKEPSVIPSILVKVTLAAVSVA